MQALCLISVRVPGKVSLVNFKQVFLKYQNIFSVLQSLQKYHTVFFTDLNKPNLLIVVRFLKIKLIFSTALVASKNDACYKSGQNRLKNNHLDTLI